MERSIAIPLGVIVERRALDHAWAKWSWRPAAVLPGAGPVQDWREIERSEKLVRWHAATLQLELHRKETEAYKVNLSSRLPVVYVVLRREEAAGAPPGCEVRPFRVTASPFEAQNFLDSGEDIVEGVPMPESVIAWVQAFVDRHHVDAPFKKRERKRFAPDEAAFGRAPGRLDGQGIKRGPHGRD